VTTFNPQRVSPWGKQSYLDSELVCQAQGKRRAEYEDVQLQQVEEATSTAAGQ